MRMRLKAAMMALAIAGILSMFPKQASACDAIDPFIGSVCVFALDFCPRNWLATDGRVLKMEDYQSLYALLGNRYGGNADDLTFALPEIENPDLKTCIAIQGIFPSRPK